MLGSLVLFFDMHSLLRLMVSRIFGITELCRLCSHTCGDLVRNIGLAKVGAETLN